MLLRNRIIGMAGALALAGFFAGPAFAEGFDGLLDADYAHLSTNHGGGNDNDYGGGATGMFDVGSGFAVQGDGGYHHGDGSSSDWNVDGSVFWTGMRGRIGATGGYDSVNGDGADIHATHYGAFGNWYAMRSITIGVKGGGFSGSGDAKGEYLGAALTGYVTPNFSLQGGYDYTHLDHFGNENDWSARAEYLLSERTPLALYAGYTNSKLSDGGPTTNVFTVGLTYFFGSGRPESLVVRQRTGAEEWGNTFAPTLLH